MGLHHFIDDSTGPRCSLSRFHRQENKASKNDSSLIRDKWCHLTLCLRLVIVSDLLKRSSKRDRDVAEGVDDVRAAQVPGEER